MSDLNQLFSQLMKREEILAKVKKKHRPKLIVIDTKKNK